MATLTQQTATPAAPLTSTGRLLSLDAFRGLTMFLLISHGFGIYEALKGIPVWSAVASQFEHAPWTGCTLWDLIQPAFTFVVGAAMPLSLGRRRQFGSAFPHVLWRAAALIVLSNILSNWNTTGPLKLQFINVLCQIAFSYVICYLLLQLPFRAQVVAASAILVAHHALFFAFPGPQGPFDAAANIGARIDTALLGYNYSGYYTTINFLGNALTVLAGCWTGRLLLSGRSGIDLIRRLCLTGVTLLLAGAALAPFVPMIKRLWTGSFMLFSTGWVLIAFAVIYWLVEVRGWRGWTFPLVVIGVNSIFIYAFSQVLRGWLSRGIGNFDGRQFAFLGPLGAIPHNLLVTCAMWGLCYWLYQRKIFLKI